MGKLMVDLRLGDCLEILPTLADKSVDAIITDPPYGLKSIMQGGGWAKNMEYIKDGADWDEKPVSQETILKISKLSDKCIIWGGNYFELPSSRGWLVWNKRGMGFTMAQAELAWTNLDIPVRVFDYFTISQKRLHPTEKPLSLMLWCIENFTKSGDTILDPFMGSGTTGVACVKLNRNFIGIEKEPKYFAIAQKRIKEAQQQMIMPFD